MEGLILGIDLSEQYCRISASRMTDPMPKEVVFDQAENRTVIQTVLGKKKNSDEWMIGMKAYESVLTGEGVIADGLLVRLGSSEKIAVGGESFSAEDLMTRFLGSLFERAFRQFECRNIEMAVISVRTVTVDLIDSLTRCMESLGISREKVRILSDTEAFLYYMLAQKKEYFSNDSVLFDWNSKELHFYCMSINRKAKPAVVRVVHQILNESFPVENTEEERTLRVADAQLAGLAEKTLEGKKISSVWLSGKGFENCQSWPTMDFIHQVGEGRHVYTEQSIFANGAVIIGVNQFYKKAAFPYTIICEGRIRASIEMDVVYHGAKRHVCLAEQGSCWYDVIKSVDLILEDTEGIQIRVVMSEGKLIRTFFIPLDNFPRRPPKTTRVQVILTFASENEAIVRVIDRGFGEFFPASGAVKKSRILLS